MNTPHEPTDDSLTRATADFVRHKARMFGIAYRILGSVAEAEDVVQDTWLRWQSTDRSTVVDPGAFLSTISARLAINVAQSARVRREAYVGPWLPEPVDTGVDPQVGAERGEALELAVLLLLEKLKPVERAAYVLREAFDYPYDQIADILHLKQDNVRQIISRSKKRLAAERRETRPVDGTVHRRLLEAFVSAAQTGDVVSLEKLLSADATSYADGNGIRGAARTVVRGAQRVARIAAHSKRLVAGNDYRYAEANGRPALLVFEDGVLSAFVSITVSDGWIQNLYYVLSPAKLQAYERSTDRATPLLP
ncbi:RNA polymerase subunit sigma-24 [Streptomyces sp. CS113]|uniref:sigma-70 family RNA polymerase sigma factor n=1 Tax=Streptomyces sp. CS113 TaxID=1982761 RepID=UPI000B423320|nr:sigma-70 family RNA polymerase sigma factor [Streptomyces sp. CS113]OWA13901.1 RNA polymerase subunit sigma-24 [Streptomyces sp. CS113]